MTHSILVAAPASCARPLADALPKGFAVTLCVNADRARVLVRIGDYQAVLTVEGFLDDLAHPAKLVVPAETVLDPVAVAEWTAAAMASRNLDDRRRARALVSLSTVRYGEYAELARYRSTREYLLGLVEHFRGNVTDAARTGGIARESLHRLLRRHDVDAESFREPSASGLSTPDRVN